MTKSMDDRKIFTKSVGDNVRRERISKKLTQDELADNCGFYRTTINLIETARRSPSAYTLHRIAKGLNVNISKLYPPLDS